MRISFDLDDTLICYQSYVPGEWNRIPWVLRRWLPEPFRLGSVELIRALRERSWEVWVYTTSGRCPFLVSCWLWFYGIRVAGVINDAVYRNTCSDIGFTTTPARTPDGLAWTCMLMIRTVSGRKVSSTASMSMLCR
jgi:hypothetical protein